MALELIMEILSHSWKIFASPWTNIETLWMVLPLVLILVLIHLYFGKHRTEELGWNSAFSNSISLLWVCMLLLRAIYNKHGAGLLLAGEGLTKLIIVGILVLWVMIMLTFNFFHVLPKKLAFAVSSSDFVYVLAYIIISLVIGNIELNRTTLWASIFLFIAMNAVLYIFKMVVPISESSKKTLEARKKKKKIKMKKNLDKAFDWVKNLFGKK